MAFVQFGTSLVFSLPTQASASIRDRLMFQYIIPLTTRKQSTLSKDTFVPNYHQAVYVISRMMMKQNSKIILTFGVRFVSGHAIYFLVAIVLLLVVEVTSKKSV